MVKNIHHPAAVSKRGGGKKKKKKNCSLICGGYVLGSFFKNTNPIQYSCVRFIAVRDHV